MVGIPNITSHPPFIRTRARTRDGRELEVERVGTGSPVVVFEAGMGSSHHAWGAVVPLVAARTATAAYDRSGFGRSPADPEARSVDRLAGDLLDVLHHLGDGPFVLVGHSWGGPIVRVAASIAPERVGGLVLVDQTDESCDLFFGRSSDRQMQVGERVLPLLARLRLLRIAVGRLARQLPEPAASAMRAEDGTSAAVRAQLAELRACPADLRRLRADPPALPVVPVTVISGTRNGLGERRRRPALVAAHSATAAALPLGRHVRAERSTHYVPFTEPGLVADEIFRIVDALRDP